MADLMHAHFDESRDLVTIWLDRERAEAVAEVALEVQIEDGRDSPLAGLHAVIEDAIEEVKNRSQHPHG